MLHILAGVALVVTSASAQAEGVTIRWKLAKGDIFYTRTVTSLNQTIDVAGMTMEQEQEQTVIHRYKVMEAGPKRTVIEQTVMKSDVMGNIPMAAEYAGRMKGAVLTYTLDDKFRVTRLDGYDKYLEKIAGDDEMARAALRTFVTENNLKLGIEDMFGVAPDKPVRPGDAWKRNNKVSLGPLGEFSLDSTFKLVGVENGVARITTAAQAKFVAPKDGADAAPFRITKGELKAEKFTGSVEFNINTGRLTKARSEMVLSGTLTISVGGAETDIDIKQNLTTASSVSDKNLGDD